jgi:hypothetical protein
MAPTTVCLDRRQNLGSHLTRSLLGTWQISPFFDLFLSLEPLAFFASSRFLFWLKSKCHSFIPLSGHFCPFRELFKSLFI